MTIVLLVLSLAIHLFTFFVLILFYQQMQKVKEERSDLYGVREDMEELLSRYTDEMKQENQELKQYFADQKNVQPTETAPPEAMKNRVSPQESPFNMEKQEIHSPSFVTEEEDVEEPAYVPPLTDNADKVESSDQAKVLSLSSQGYTRDEIAKKLDIGKGEVDLFLKFYQ
ncbi:hypothetical protein D7Z54_13890 [Salibacterium salarium]|uniref:Swarming motility protein SwrB n=1 Tax=Salibacterium salarium TaxID=284579 RepID=A0A3R9P7A7_9BACI|nr:hypothetical protein [Salibacterium salarium]RSL32830.1 hypothetical protein D7Z54_13890 [Salibacterium salarium]